MNFVDYHMVYHWGLPYRLPLWFTPGYYRNYPPELRLTEGGGAPPSVDIEKYKNSITNIMRKN